MGNKIKQKYFCIGGKHQNFNVNLNRIMPYSAVALVGIFGLMFFPVSFAMDSTEAAPVQSTTTLTLATSDLSAEITPSSTSGTFVASDPITIGVRTNNYTGYTLGITSSDNVNNTKLINTNDSIAYLTSISSASDPEEFNANNWGYLPDKLNSETNTKYQPAPTTTATTLETTSTSNQNPKTYRITLGVKADYSLPAGTYENSFILTAVANPVAYSITYNKNTEDTVENMPENQSGTIDEADITIPNTTPTREHYTFQGWCNVTPATDNGVDSCSGTTYQPGDTVDMNKTAENNTILHALWKVDTFTQTTQVRYEVANADGTYGSYTTVDTQTLNYGSTYSWSTSQISGFDTNTYSSASVASYTVTEDHTNQVNITRKSYVLTVNRNTNYISSVSGAGTYKVGKVVSISATASSGNKFTSWSQTAGTTSSFGSTSSASTTFTMPASAATIYANGAVDKIYMQNITTATCPTSRTLVYDSRDEKSYHIQKIGSLCWMTDNLALGANPANPNTTSISINSTNTNINTSKTLTLYDLAANGASGQNCYGKYAASTGTGTGNGYTYLCMHTSNEGNSVWYNYAAASAGTITGTENTTESTYDICPAGWRLPTHAENSAVASYTAAFSPVYGGYYYNGSLYNATTVGYWWSSTAYSGPLRYDLNYHSGSLNTGNYYRYNGFYVRCVRNS